MSSPKKKIAPLVHPLVPERLAYIFETRPVLWFEDEAAYDTMLADFIAEYSPQDLIDYHAMKELGEAQWHLMRLRRISKAALEAEMPDTMTQQLGSDYWKYREKLGVDGHEDSLKRYARMATRKDASGESAIEELMDLAKVNYDVLLYRAFIGNLMTISALNEKIAQAERRRDDIIRKYEERRRTLTAMSKSLIEGQRSTDTNTVEDINPE